MFGVAGCAIGFVVSLIVGLITGFGDDASGLQNYKPKAKKAK